MNCDKINTPLCGCLTKCEECDIDYLNYKIIPKIDLQKASFLKCKPALLKGKSYNVIDGMLINEFEEKINIGKFSEFYKEHGEYINFNFEKESDK